MDLAVKVQPRAKRPAVGGMAADGPALRVAVAEPPEDGRANKAVCQAVARALGVAPSSVELLQGGGARKKLLRVTGDPRALMERLEKLLA